VMWFRRDLRLRDHPALAAACSEGRVLALFVRDPALWSRAGLPRIAFLCRSLAALDGELRRLGGGLVVRSGRPEQVVPEVARQVGASSVHVSADYGPYGSGRDGRVEAALSPVPLVRTGSPYAVGLENLLTSAGTPFRVYSPYYRAWAKWPIFGPAEPDWRGVEWETVASEGLPPEPDLPSSLLVPAAGEAAARATWERFREDGLPHYERQRDRLDLDSTSRLSVYLKFGCIHPRTLLASLGAEHQRFRKELAWREFYAYVLHFWPESARQSFQPRMRSLRWETGQEGEEHFRAWKLGQTGYPIVDAGMRQLLTEGWVHNRVRMIVASFLVKDLHIDWVRGARYFMERLVDGDLASNQHGWQWTAGTGTDAAPFYRVFNPVSQGRKFDPDGAYVRHWVPELAGVDAKFVHEPWRAVGGVPKDYFTPIVNHAQERLRSLDAYKATAPADSRRGGSRAKLPCSSI
jgi:deoxyribodipyrimidine photo-lyase